MVPLDSPDPQAAYDALRREIKAYSEALHAKAHVVILSKRDLVAPDAPLPPLSAPDASGVIAISSSSGRGIDELKEYLWEFVETARGPHHEATAGADLEIEWPDDADG